MQQNNCLSLFELLIAKKTLSTKFGTKDIKRTSMSLSLAPSSIFRISLFKMEIIISLRSSSLNFLYLLTSVKTRITTEHKFSLVIPSLQYCSCNSLYNSITCLVSIFLECSRRRLFIFNISIYKK